MAILTVKEILKKVLELASKLGIQCDKLETKKIVRAEFEKVKGNENENYTKDLIIGKTENDNNLYTSLTIFFSKSENGRVNTGFEIKLTFSSDFIDEIKNKIGLSLIETCKWDSGILYFFDQ